MKKFIFLVLSFTYFNQLVLSQNGCVYFEPTSSSYIDFGSSPWSNAAFASNQLTISLWMKWDTKTNSPSWANLFTLTQQNNNGDQGTFWVQHNSDNSRIEFAIQTNVGRRFIQSTTNPLQNEWYHVTGVYDGAQMLLYVNGVLESTTTHTGSLNYSQSNNLVLNAGRWANPANNHRQFNGWLSDISIWKTVLTQAQVQSLMNGTLPMTSPNLLGYWMLENPSTIQDLSSNGINGTALNLGDCAGSALPIELLFFEAKPMENGNLLRWATATERNNDYFTIHFSTDGITWETLSYINGSGTTNFRNDYEYIHTFFSAKTIYYRLEQTDYDGQKTIFFPISVQANASSSKIIGYFNLSGQQVNEFAKGIVIVRYSDGSSEKRVNF